jgi:hypothetical protein
MSCRGREQQVRARIPNWWSRRPGETDGHRYHVGRWHGVEVAVVEVVQRVQAGSGAPVEHLVCHPRLPLVAGLDSERPAVHVWECEAGELRERGTRWRRLGCLHRCRRLERREQTSTATWHLDQPLLVVAGEGTVAEWAPAGVPNWKAFRPVPPTAVWRSARTVRRCVHRQAGTVANPFT